MRYLVKLWLDPYNESGQYQEVTQTFGNRNRPNAIQAANDRQYPRAMVIDTWKTYGTGNSCRLLYARGFE